MNSNVVGVVLCGAAMLICALFALSGLPSSYAPENQECHEQVPGEDLKVFCLVQCQDVQPPDTTCESSTP